MDFSLRAIQPTVPDAALDLALDATAVDPGASSLGTVLHADGGGEGPVSWPAILEKPNEGLFVYNQFATAQNASMWIAGDAKIEGNVIISSLAGVGTRLVQADANGKLVPGGTLSIDWASITGRPNNGAFIYNSTSQQTAANFNIDGTGIAAKMLVGGSVFSSTEKLRVGGDARIDANALVGSSIWCDNFSTFNGSLPITFNIGGQAWQIKSGATNLFYVNSSGQVMINATTITGSAAEKFKVSGNARIDSNLIVGHASNYTGGYALQVNGSAFIAPGGVMTDGMISFGPQTATIAQMAAFRSSIVNGSRSLWLTANDFTFNNYNGTAYVSFAVINNSGALLINKTVQTYTGYKLEVLGPASFLSGNNFLITSGSINSAIAAEIGTSDATALAFLANGTAKMFISSGGQVGINTTTFGGTEKLHVSGSTLLDGSLTASAGVVTGVNMNHTLVAAANNDVLTGLSINPTFTPGAFTGVKQAMLNVGGALGDYSVDILGNPLASFRVRPNGNASAFNFFVIETSGGSTQPMAINGGGTVSFSGASNVSLIKIFNSGADRGQILVNNVASGNAVGLVNISGNVGGVGAVLVVQNTGSTLPRVLDILNSTSVSLLNVSASGQVGINTTTFVGTEKLRVGGTAYIDSTLTVNGGVITGNTSIATVSLTSAGGAQLNFNGTTLMVSTGRVQSSGIFNATAASFLVSGSLGLANLAADPASPTNGWMYYNTTSDSIKVFVAGAWKTITVS
jgi:hypothetical protein